MGETKKKTKQKTPLLQENMMINLAMDLAEKKLRDGSASNMLICHFLELATERKRLENKRLMADVKLANAKIKDLEMSVENGKAYKDALDAFKRYSGNRYREEEDEDEEYD